VASRARQVPDDATRFRRARLLLRLDYDYFSLVSDCSLTNSKPPYFYDSATAEYFFDRDPELFRHIFDGGYTVLVLNRVRMK